MTTHVTVGVEMTPEEARERGKLGAHVRWAKEADRRAAVEPMIRGQQAAFERQVDPDGTLDPRERAFRAEHARKAHMQRMQIAAAKKRKQKQAAAARPAARKQTCETPRTAHPLRASHAGAPEAAAR